MKMGLWQLPLKPLISYGSITISLSPLSPTFHPIQQAAIVPASFLAEVILKTFINASFIVMLLYCKSLPSIKKWSSSNLAWDSVHCHMKGNDGFQYVLTLNVHSYPTLTPSFVSVYGQGKKGSQASHSIGQELELLPLDHCSTPVATALLTPVCFPRRKLPICFEHKFSETGIHACLKLLST